MRGWLQKEIGSTALGIRFRLGMWASWSAYHGALTIKPLVIGRKAWLFSDTSKGATACAQIYSLVETAKVNGQEPYTWLRHVLERLPHASSVEDYEALLPRNCSPETPK